MRPGFRSWSRWFAVGTLLLAAAWLSLHVWNRSRFDLAGFDESADRVLDRADQILARVDDFDQERALNSLPPNPYSGPSFRFDERLDEAVVSPAAGSARHQIPFVRLEFDPGDAIALEYDDEAAGAVAQPADSMLGLTHEEGRYLQTREPLRVDWLTLGRIELRMRHELGEQLHLVLAKGMMDTVKREWSPEVGSITVNTIPDGQFHTYTVDAETALEHQYNHLDRIQRMFLLPSNVPGDRVEIDYIRFVPRKLAFAEERTGRSFITIERQSRHVLFAHAPLELTWKVQVPERAPVMEFGLGVLEAGDPVEFGIEVVAAGEAQSVFRQAVEGNETWSDYEVDLSPWAGQPVEVRLSTHSAGGNVGFWSSPELRGEPIERMNVVMILEDTLRADHLSCYGYERQTSPARDAMAADGVIFTSAFAQGTETRVSCPSLMTSLFPTATGVWNFRHKLADNFVTLPEALRAQGFTTAAFIQNNQAGTITGLHQGYDVFYDEFSVGEGPDKMYSDRVYDWLQDNGDRNFFLYLHLMDPHDPYEPPDEFNVWRDEVPEGTPPGREGGYEVEKANYDGEILWNDHYFGRFMARLEQMGLKENTLFVFTSDHGEYFGEHGLELHVPPAYTEVLNVPLIMALPGRLPSGARVETPVQLTDVMPTVLELTGIPPDPFLMQGDSLLPLVRGEDDDYWASRIVHADDVRDMVKGDPPGWGATFFGDWQAVNSRRYLADDGKQPEPLLPTFVSMRMFNRADQFHTGSPDLAMAADPLLRRRLQNFVFDLQGINEVIWQRMTRDTLSEAEYDSATIARLRDLGYLD